MAVVEEMIEGGDGARLWTVTEGVGRPAVLCHGGPGGTDNLAPVAAMIADVVRVSRFEQRGCGRSSGGPPFTMAGAVADLDALRRHWGHDRWLVGGHSFGAALALAYAIAHPERVDAVVGVSCVIRLDGQEDWYEQYRRHRFERMTDGTRRRFSELRRRRDEEGELSPALDRELRSLAADTEFGDAVVAARKRTELVAELAATNPTANLELGADFVRWFAAARVHDQLHELDAPVLLVRGTADPRPLAAVEALAAELRRPRLVALDGVGHFPFWEAPGALRTALRDFLGSLP
jgi:proline iminopeptidase